MHVERNRYSVRDRKKECRRERRLVEKQRNRKIEMLARGRSASVCVRYKSQVDQKAKLCVWVGQR
jgi:hypothetical protein